jgi:hypothetical protein
MHIDPVRARAIPGEGNSRAGRRTARADPSEGTCRPDRPGERLWMQQMQQMQQMQR